MSVLRRKINVYIFYHYCKYVVAILPMCNEVVIKIVLPSKIDYGSQKKFTVVSVQVICSNLW